MAERRPSSTKTTTRSRPCWGAAWGRCTRSLRSESNDPAFAPEAAGAATTAQWAEQAQQQLAAAFAALDAQTEWDASAADDLAAVNVRARWH